MSCLSMCAATGHQLSLHNTQVHGSHPKAKSQFSEYAHSPDDVVSTIIVVMSGVKLCPSPLTENPHQVYAANQNFLALAMCTVSVNEVV